MNNLENKQEKKTLDESFDVIGVINKTYQDSTEYDLNDSLIFLGNVIAKTKVSNKELVKKNFSKFVECRIVLEEILEDMKRKGLDQPMTGEVIESINNLERKFKEITGSFLTKEHFNSDREKRILFMKKYKTLFNLKELLKANLKHNERFIMIYEEGLKQFEELKDSEFVQNLWESCKEIKNKFLEKLYSEIQNENNCYTEVLYFFNLYFKIAEPKSDRKVMNTLLINFKEKVLDLPCTNKGIFLKETNYLFLKTFIHLDKDLQRELTKHLFEKVKIIFDSSSLPFIKVWIKKYKGLIKHIEVSLEVSSSYFTILKYLLKSLIHSKIVQSSSFDNLLIDLKQFDDLLEKEEKYILYSRFIEVIKDKIEFDDCKEIDILNKFDNLLKGNNESFEEFQEIKKNIVNREIKREIVLLSEFIKKNSNKTCILMEIIKTIKRNPQTYKKIFIGASSAISKDKIILYFLNNLIEKENPKLNNQQEEEIVELEKQFSFLRKLH